MIELKTLKDLEAACCGGSAYCGGGLVVDNKVVNINAVHSVDLRDEAIKWYHELKETQDEADTKYDIIEKQLAGKNVDIYPSGWDGGGECLGMMVFIELFFNLSEEELK